MNGPRAGTMNERPSNRRGFLRALFGGAALMSASRISGARAEATKAPDLTPGQLKSDCDAHEGTTYVESKKDDVSACFWSDKSKTVCKFNGKDCYNYPPPKPSVGGGVTSPFGGFDWEATLDVAEEVDPGPAADDGLDAVPAEGAAKRRRRRGKRRKR